MSFQIFGLPVSRGIAIGRAVLVASSRVDVDHYFIDEDQIAAEVGRLDAARVAVMAEFEVLKHDLPVDAPGEIAALLDVHLMLLNDELLIEAAKHWITDRHYNAEWALSAQLEVLARQFDEMEEAYLRERKADLEQIVERLLSRLKTSATHPHIHPGAGPDQVASMALSHDSSSADDALVLVAADISPADMLQFKRSVFTGFVTDVGGKTSHTAIVARSLDIPAVVGARHASDLIQQDDWVIIDGDAGVVIVDPSPIILEEYRFRQRQSDLERQRLSRLRHTPAVSLDGERVELLANIELPGDTAIALDSGAQGIGLFRSEFLFMNRHGKLPSEDEQFEAYRSVVSAMKDMPVTIRTVDIGADKPLERLTAQELKHESMLNPALGLRAIRWSLAEPAMFRQQLRAIMRASAFGPVRLLVPMLAHLSEIRQTFDAINQARQQLLEAGQTIGQIEVGAMIEIPAAALSMPTFLRFFDFISVGTNDLIQYTLAIDRADEDVAHLYDPWHPAILRILNDTIEYSRRVGKSVSVCGEVAGDTSFTEILLAMGLRSFSMHPTQIAAVKQRILRSDTKRLSAKLASILASDEPEQTAKQAFASHS